MTKITLDLNRGIPFNLYEDELLGAVLLSLFCDARGTEPDGSIGRGWWGDDLAERDEWGSRRAEDAANDALSWMLADGLARSISVMAYSPAREVLGLVIKIDNVKQTLEIRHAV